MVYVALLLGSLRRALRPRSALLLENLAVAAAARRLPATRRAAPAPAPCWGSTLLVAARTDVARLAFAAAVRPARDRDSVASHRVATVLGLEEPQTRTGSAAN